MKPARVPLRRYELALGRLEIVRPELEHENRAVAAPRADAAALEQRQIGGRA